jgi:hypothetical protein
VGLFYLQLHCSTTVLAEDKEKKKLHQDQVQHCELSKGEW